MWSSCGGRLDAQGLLKGLHDIRGVALGKRVWFSGRVSLRGSRAQLWPAPAALARWGRTAPLSVLSVRLVQRLRWKSSVPRRKCLKAIAPESFVMY